MKFKVQHSSLLLIQKTQEWATIFFLCTLHEKQGSLMAFAISLTIGKDYED